MNQTMQTMGDYIKPVVGYVTNMLLSFSDPVKVNCHQCGTELTNIGGDVTSNGRYIYCHENGEPLKCVDAAMHVGNQDLFYGSDMVHYSAKKVQKGIRTGELKITPLERKAQVATQTSS